MAHTERVAGETVFGSNRQQSTVALLSADTTAPGLVLLDTAGTEYVLWVDTAGKFKIGTRANFTTPNSAGTIVGTQS